MKSFTIFPLHNNIMKATGLILAFLTIVFKLINIHFQITNFNNIINWIFCFSLFLFAFGKFDNENNRIKELSNEALKITMGLELFVLFAITLTELIKPINYNISLLLIVFSVISFYIVIFYILILADKKDITNAEEFNYITGSKKFYVIYFILIVVIFVFGGYCIY